MTHDWETVREKKIVELSRKGPLIYDNNSRARLTPPKWVGLVVTVCSSVSTFNSTDRGFGYEKD